MRLINVWPAKQQQCTRCGEYWPLTLEFYRILPRQGIPRRWDRWCRACGCEVRRENKLKRKQRKGGASAAQEQRVCPDQDTALAGR